MRALLVGDWWVTGGVLKIASCIWEVVVAGWPVTGRRRGRSEHYCDGLDCGLPLVAFWQHNSNAVCLVAFLKSCGCWLTHVDLYNGFMVVCACVFVYYIV